MIHVTKMPIPVLLSAIAVMAVFASGRIAAAQDQPVAISWGVLKSCLETTTVEKYVSIVIYNKSIRGGINSFIVLKNKVSDETVELHMNKTSRAELDEEYPFLTITVEEIFRVLLDPEVAKEINKLIQDHSQYRKYVHYDLVELVHLNWDNRIALKANQPDFPLAGQDCDYWPPH